MTLRLTILRALHPDTNGGDHSRTEEFQRALREHRIRNTFCACGCGQKIDPARMRFNPKTKLAGQFCKGRYVGNILRKPRKLAVALAILLTTISIHAQTNSAAFNAGMSQAMSIVTNAIAHPETVGINPMVQTATGTNMDSAPLVQPLTKPLFLHLTWTPSASPATNAAGQTLVTVIVRCPDMTAPMSLWRAVYTGTGTNYTYCSTNTDGYWPETGQCYFRAGAAYESLK